jgi:hypothetical protein
VVVSSGETETALSVGSGTRGVGCHLHLHVSLYFALGMILNFWYGHFSD